MSMRRQISRIRKQSAVSARRPEAVTDPFRPGTSKAELGAGRGGGGLLFRSDHAMSASTA